MPDEQISRFLDPAIISLQSYWYIRCFVLFIYSFETLYLQTLVQPSYNK